MVVLLTEQSLVASIKYLQAEGRPEMANIPIKDLSGTVTPVTSNPYDGLISACHDDPVRSNRGVRPRYMGPSLTHEQKELQERYQQHRVTRNEQQKAKILDDEFKGWILDEHLVKLQGPRRDPGYVDPRYCLVFWARPPSRLRKLVEVIQAKLTDAAPGELSMRICYSADGPQICG